MPQLDFSLFPSQLFWLSVSFLVMLFLMSKFIIPRTAEMINLRKAKIDNDLREAQELKRRVEETLEKYNQALRNATKEANLSLQKTKDDLEDIVERKQNLLMQELSQEISAGEEKIAASQRKALAEVDNVAKVLVPQILVKMGFEEPSDKEVKKALQATGEE